MRTHVLLLIVVSGLACFGCDFKLEWPDIKPGGSSTPAAAVAATPTASTASTSGGIVMTPTPTLTPAAPSPAGAATIPRSDGSPSSKKDERHDGRQEKKKERHDDRQRDERQRDDRGRDQDRGRDRDRDQDRGQDRDGDRDRGHDRDADRDVLDRVLALTNEYRAQASLPPLRRDDDLDRAAQRYADRMAAEGFFDHESPSGDGPGERASAVGYPWRTLGENIARGHRSAEEVVRDWIRSPSHRANLENPNVDEIGLGVARGDRLYWVQELGARRR
ncbi:MAG: CAP domain-containing protein [Deltaproteobacteria bacterium]|nr:CAP domain-containing protein [Deltaproteobacteria bacterium]